MLDRNTWNQITVCKKMFADKGQWNIENIEHIQISQILALNNP